MKTIARAPGKIVLLGEYAVLEAAPAVVTAVNRLAEVTLEPVDADHFIIDAPQLGLYGAPLYAPTKTLQPGPLALVAAAINEASLWVAKSTGNWTHLRISVDTSALYDSTRKEKLGLGSSAAVTTALLAGIVRQACPDFDPNAAAQDLLMAAMAAHRHGQGGTGSGVDVAASCLGGALRFERASVDALPHTERLALPGDLHWAAVWTGQPASTPALINAVRSLRVRNASQYHQLMGELVTLAQAGCRALGAGKTADFLSTVKAYHLGLETLGKASGAPIVTPLHAQLARLAPEDCLAFKPSGAGGGDLGVVFSNDPIALETFLKRVYTAGVQPLDLHEEPCGVQLL